MHLIKTIGQRYIDFLLLPSLAYSPKFSNYKDVIQKSQGHKLFTFRDFDFVVLTFVKL